VRPGDKQYIENSEQVNDSDDEVCNYNSGSEGKVSESSGCVSSVINSKNEEMKNSWVI
jgi:hypothetical protein